MLRTIHLAGKLARFHKKPIQIDADNTQMVMQGLFQMLGPMFKQAVRDGEWHLCRNKKLKDVKSADDSIGEEELAFGLGNTLEIWVYPAVRAASAVARIVVGVVLVVVGVVLTAIGQAWASYLVKAGIGLALGGVAELLAPKPNMGRQEQAGQNPSFMFNGTVNVTEQGGPVPIVYGRVQRSSSLVLSAGITTEVMSLPPAWGGNVFMQKFTEMVGIKESVQ